MLDNHMHGSGAWKGGGGLQRETSKGGEGVVLSHEVSGHVQ